MHIQKAFQHTKAQLSRLKPSNYKTLTKLYNNESNKQATYRRIITLFLTKPSSS